MADDFFGFDEDQPRSLDPPAGYEAVHDDGMSWAISGGTYQTTSRVTPNQWNHLIAQFRGLATNPDVDVSDLLPESPLLLRGFIERYANGSIYEILSGMDVAGYGVMFKDDYDADGNGIIDLASGGTGGNYASVAALLAGLGGAPINSPVFTGNPTAPTPATSDNDTSIATTAFVKSAISDFVAANDVMKFKGAINASTNPNYPAADAGDAYRISVAGKIGGASGANVEAGDLIMCINDGTASGTHASVGANWVIAQTNLDGAVIGPASAWANGPAVYNGTTGKLLSSITYDTFLSNAGFSAFFKTLIDDANAAAVLTTLGISGIFSQVVTQVFTSSGTYTPTPGMKYCVVELVGGGGGGGGTTTSAAGNVHGGGGGGSGAYSRSTLTAAQIGSSKSVSIGAAGSAGAGGGGTGGAGGTTSLGSLVTAGGGGGGLGANDANGRNGGAGGTAGTADVALPGAQGGRGSGGVSVTFQLHSGHGAASYFGDGAMEVNSSSGLTAIVPGSGGSGGLSSGGNPANPAGGPGKAGIVIITEYL